MLAVRPVRRIRVWSRTLENAQRFAAGVRQRLDQEVEVTSTAAEAVQGADLICTTTSAPTPILHGEWISPGAHINAVGSSVPFARELDTATVARSRLYVDRRESALNEAGDILFPKREGAISDDHILGELGELLLGRVRGRAAESEITLFKSLGLAIEDVAAAHYVYHQAQAKEAGTSLQLGGSRDLRHQLP
jgi:ornithine cyclodeaminase